MQAAEKQPACHRICAVKRQVHIVVLGDPKDPADFFQEGVVCPWAAPHLDVVHLHTLTGDC